MAIIVLSRATHKTARHRAKTIVAIFKPVGYTMPASASRRCCVIVFWTSSSVCPFVWCVSTFLRWTELSESSGDSEGVRLVPAFSLDRASAGTRLAVVSGPVKTPFVCISFSDDWFSMVQYNKRLYVEPKTKYESPKSKNIQQKRITLGKTKCLPKGMIYIRKQWPEIVQCKGNGGGGQQRNIENVRIGIRAPAEMNGLFYRPAPSPMQPEISSTESVGFADRPKAVGLGGSRCIKPCCGCHSSVGGHARW